MIGQAWATHPFLWLAAWGLWNGRPPKSHKMGGSVSPRRALGSEKAKTVYPLSPILSGGQSIIPIFI